jgi:hypothetical protein
VERIVAPPVLVPGEWAFLVAEPDPPLLWEGLNGRRSARFRA